MAEDAFANSDENSPKLSKYNSAIAQLYRLDQLWQKAHMFALNGDLIKLNWVLDRVWCELSADAGDENKKKFRSFIFKIADASSKKEILYHILMEKEEFIRNVQNKQGKGTAYAESIEEYMG
jgi:hypothetical protein